MECATSAEEETREGLNVPVRHDPHTTAHSSEVYIKTMCTMKAVACGCQRQSRQKIMLVAASLPIRSSDSRLRPHYWHPE